MGYVNESSSSLPVQFSAGWTGLNGGGNTNRVFTSAPATVRSQFGFRSRDALEGAEAERVKFLNTHGTWGQQATMLDALDRIQQATTSTGVTGKQIKSCNYRDYHIVEAIPVATGGEYTYNPNGLRYRLRGAAQITQIVPSFKPASPSSSTLEGNAGKMMRRYRPTKPDFDLTRFIGELKDTPSLFRIGNYLPTGGPDLGGAYLNFQFGISPSASDIQKGAEAIVKSHEIVKDFVLRSAQSVHRSASVELGGDTISGSDYTHSGLQTGQFGPLVFMRDLGSSDTTYGNVHLEYYASFRRTQRIFSTFEYFVGDPYGYTTRMDDYLSKAKKVLGGGLTPAVAYQLTPFSWMLDWLYDIGGLLAYQQDVADNGIVQTYGGYTLEDEYYGSISLTGINFGPFGSRVTGLGTQVNIHERVLHRVPGNPYGMSPTWSMDPYKWAIVGALGLLKAKGLQPS